MKFQLPQTVKFVRTDENAKLPTKGSLGAAGFDIYSAKEYKLEPGDRVLVETGLRICVPDGFEAQVRPRSGLALKMGITVVNSPGTIDSDYRGPLGVVLINHGDQVLNIQPGSRVAQLVIQPVVSAQMVEVEDDSEFEASLRGQDGFGSTGQ